MGLSIHYSGRLQNPESLPDLIEEIREVAEIHQWKYVILDSVYPNNQFRDESGFEDIYGITFTPENCETISVCFLSDGKMVCPLGVQFWSKSEDEKERNYMYSISVKTQYAGVKAHQLIIILFKYLNHKYFEDFKMMDESYYWETDDEEMLKKRFREYNAMMDSFGLALQTIPLEENENLEDYFKRLMIRVQNQINKSKE